MSKLTKAQREWLQHLAENGPTARGRSNTAYHCMMKGWTEWFVKFQDGRIERLEGQDTTRADLWLDSITAAGRAALSEPQP
jgi:hypothetical protein